MGNAFGMKEKSMNARIAKGLEENEEGPCCVCCVCTNSCIYCGCARYILIVDLINVMIILTSLLFLFIK